MTEQNTVLPNGENNPTVVANNINTTATTVEVTTPLVENIKAGEQAEQRIENNLLEQDSIGAIRAMNQVNQEAEEIRRKGHEAMNLFRQKLERTLSYSVSRITLMKKRMTQAFQSYKMNVNDEQKVILIAIHVDNAGTNDPSKIIHESDVHQLLTDGLNAKRANAAEVFTVSTGKNGIHAVLNQNEVDFLDETIGDNARSLHANESNKVNQAAMLVMDACKGFLDRLATKAGGTNIQRLNYKYEGHFQKVAPKED